MDIKKIDRNFDTSFVCPGDVRWISADEPPFSLHGVYYSESEGIYRRMPKNVADRVNPAVAYLSADTAGGRVRFETDSPYIALHVGEPFATPFPHLTIVGQCGVSVFVNGSYEGMMTPSYECVSAADPAHGGTGNFVFDGIRYPGADRFPYLAELFFPLYNPVSSFYIGVKKDSVVKAPRGYKHERPVLFYGSSITQGGCAAKPGDDYISRLSRMLDTDFVNLGFSAGAFGEQIMAEYVSSLDMSVFVMDYDHNAPSAEHLAKTHHAFYETFRKKRPLTPVIMMTMPTPEGYETREWNKPRRDEILKSFAAAKDAGDENVYLVDCYGCFGSAENCETGTVDNVHPDSLGFLRMTRRLYPLLDALLNKKKS